MPSQELPVTISVRRPDGSSEQVRIGTATPRGEGFAITLGELLIGGAPAASATSGYGASGGYGTPSAYGARPAAPTSGFSGDSGLTFPPYGRSKGMPISGASLQDLEFYANGSRRSLSDPGKARWHDKERGLLAAIEAEIARQRGEEPPMPDMPSSPPPGDDDIPF